MTEIWKPISNFERYEVSNLGNVRSKAFTRINKRIQHGKEQEFSCYYPEKLLTPDIFSNNTTSYKRVTLSKNGKTVRFLVHRLVAQEFLPNPLNLPFVNHIDNNGLNNKVTNLEWVTHSENMLHAQKQGRLFAAQSKGGKKGAKTNRDKMFEKFKRVENTFIGSWLVLGNPVYEGNSKKRWKLLCKCSCGYEKYQNADLILNNKLTCCSSCALKKRKR